MTERDEIRRANWLELFFDLVFVYAIAKTTHVIGHTHAGHVSARSYGLFVLILIPVWWAWTGHTLFATRFDRGDTLQRLLTLAQMLAALALSVFINPDFDATYPGWLASYLAVRGLLLAMYARAARRDPLAAPLIRRLCAGFGLGLAVAAGSVAFAPPWRYVVLYLGLAIEIATPPLMRSRLAVRPVDPHHLPERFGLLTIILLGESVVAIGTSLERHGLGPATLVAAAVGFVTLAAAWWAYFSLSEARIAGRELGHGQRIVYWHLPLYAGLAVGANFVRFAIDPALALPDHALMGAVGTCAFVAGLVAIHGSAVVSEPQSRNALLVLLAGIAALLALSH